MFFVAQPEYYRQVPHRLADLNELCLLNNSQRKYAFRQQQQEKRQIQKVNQPEMSLTQDLENYYVVLAKRVNRSNYTYMQKFNGYALKQVERSLVVRSTRDNFYKNINLPSNIDLDRDITYKILDNGYKMVVTIPKRVSYQIKTTAFGSPDILDGLSLRLLPSACGDRLVRNGAAVVGAEKASRDDDRGKKVGSGSESCGIRIPISDGYINTEECLRRQREEADDEDIEDYDDEYAHQEEQEPLVDTTRQNASPSFPLRQVGGEGSEAVEGEVRCEGEGAADRALQGEELKEEGADEEDEAFATARVPGPVSSPSNVPNPDALGGESRESQLGRDVRSSEGPSPDLLKNYTTLQRKTVFLPNTTTEMEVDKDSDEEEEDEMPVSIPVRRTKSPTLEEVVDEEFL
ncbi:hypothetical protein PMKS-000560 [Pichia membranifaciens]|uniref:Uncharacterized protein n=1 Tax=Pichia membranifaciens TaxID=4926 RepID=A0A1Q2YC41_9ASCO|nr:hypothetical protein PMKS-000560 [Pichia membranifaciens]